MGTAALWWAHPLDKRRTARWHKVNSHILFPGATTIWCDASQKIIADPTPLLDYAAPIGTFRHPDRTCVYQEVEACVRLQKDNPELMRRQVAHYRNEWYSPAYAGLVETACVVRSGTLKVKQFNKMRWSEINQYCYRDQLSFNPVAWKLNTQVKHIPGCRSKSAFFQFVPHKGR